MNALVITAGPVYNVDVDGMCYRDMALDDLRARGVAEVVVLGLVKARLSKAVDDAAERARLEVTTPGAGQAMEYQQAQVEAFDALAETGTVPAGKYPMLEASIGLDVDPQTGKPAADVLGVARSVKAAYLAWLKIGAAIRGARLTGKAAIDAADTVEAAEAAFSAVAWPVAG